MHFNWLKSTPSDTLSCPRQEPAALTTCEPQHAAPPPCLSLRLRYSLLANFV